MTKWSSFWRTAALAGSALLLGLPHAAEAGEASFLTGPNPGAPRTIALDYIQSRGAALGAGVDDLSDLVVTDEYVSQHTGVTHVHLQQRLGGIEIAGATVNVNVAADGSVISLGNRLVTNLRAAAPATTTATSPVAAVQAAAAHLGLAISEPLSVQQPLGVPQSLGGASRAAVLSTGGISLRPIPARLVYQPVSGALRLAWNVQIYERSTTHYWDLNVDAATGEVLSQHDLVVHDDWGGPTSAASPRSASALAGSSGSSSYNVFAQPVESPNHGPQSVVVDPADVAASPFGWHDTNGTAGAEFTDTRGNNVNAQEDQDANNSGGARPSGGAGLNFTAPFDPLLDPAAGSNLAASITNLFYWNNINHDVFYLYGFDEPSGNFQANNYGAGGVAGDQVEADALDGSGTNNANMLTLFDGFPPRMQMFRWTLPFPNEVFVNSPGSIAGSYAASGAVFGPSLDPTGLTADIVLVDDGTGDVNDGCQALIHGGQVNGKIALVDRGSCLFTTKVKNAQNVGAIATIVVNNQGNTPITLGGVDPSVAIPSVMIGQSNGDIIKAELPGVNATVRQVAPTPPIATAISTAASSATSSHMGSATG